MFLQPHKEKIKSFRKVYARGCNHPNAIIYFNFVEKIQESIASLSHPEIKFGVDFEHYSAMGSYGSRRDGNFSRRSYADEKCGRFDFVKNHIRFEFRCGGRGGSIHDGRSYVRGRSNSVKDHLGFGRGRGGRGDSVHDGRSYIREGSDSVEDHVGFGRGCDGRGGFVHDGKGYVDEKCEGSNSNINCGGFGRGGFERGGCVGHECTVRGDGDPRSSYTDSSRGSGSGSPVSQLAGSSTPTSNRASSPAKASPCAIS